MQTPMMRSFLALTAISMAGCGRGGKERAGTTAVRGSQSATPVVPIDWAHPSHCRVAGPKVRLPLP
jgi:hypothetical protein